MINFKLKIPSLGISAVKKTTSRELKKSGVSHSKIVYCKAVLKNDKYYAQIGDKYYPFTLQSTKLSGKPVIFYKERDKRGNQIKYTRNAIDAVFRPGSSLLYTPFGENHVYSGRLVKIEKELKFDVLEYIGYKEKYELLKE